MTPKVRLPAWRKAGPALPPLGVTAEDLSLLVRRRRVRAVRSARPRLLS